VTAQPPGSLVFPPPDGSADGSPGRPPAVPEAASGLGRHTAVLLVSGFFAVVLAAVSTLLPVPYVELRPGPALNTLGSQDGRSLISVTGHETYPTSGQLDLTTVSVLGGPGQRLNLWEVVYSWLSSSDTVVPEENLFPAGVTEQESEQENAKQMESSQKAATAAAMSVLGVDVPTLLGVDQVDPSVPAAGVLRSGDVLLDVDGAAVDDVPSLRAALAGVEPGAQVTLRIRRDGAVQTVSTATIDGEDGRAMIGVYVNVSVEPSFQFPYTVEIQIDDIGGPSAGMMFALGIVDVLTPGPMTGGKHIAGTGTIDAGGTVGPIGGIQQKMIGARRAGADWFLAPALDCPEVVGHVPEGLHVVQVSTLPEAITAVRTIASGQGTDALPTCTP
jgi:Lon-like protease